jgi:hypothetical protein
VVMALQRQRRRDKLVLLQGFERGAMQPTVKTT